MGTVCAAWGGMVGSEKETEKRKRRKGNGKEVERRKLREEIENRIGEIELEK